MCCCKCNIKLKNNKQFTVQISRNHGCVECYICQDCAQKLVKWLNIGDNYKEDRNDEGIFN